MVHLPEKIPVILISTKHDLPNYIKTDKLSAFIQQHSINNYLQTSALDGRGVNMAFRKLVESIAIQKGLL